MSFSFRIRDVLHLLLVQRIICFVLLVELSQDLVQRARTLAQSVLELLARRAVHEGDSRAVEVDHVHGHRIQPHTREHSEQEPAEEGCDGDGVHREGDVHLEHHVGAGALAVGLSDGVAAARHRDGEAAEVADVSQLTGERRDLELGSAKEDPHDADQGQDDHGGHGREADRRAPGMRLARLWLDVLAPLREVAEGVVRPIVVDCVRDHDEDHCSLGVEDDVPDVVHRNPSVAIRNVYRWEQHGDQCQRERNHHHDPRPDGSPLAF